MTQVNNKSLDKLKRMNDIFKSNPNNSYSLKNINYVLGSGSRLYTIKKYVSFLIYLGVVEMIEDRGKTIRYKFKELYK